MGETDETLPDIRQAKKLATLYHRTLDELIEFDTDLEMIEDAIHSIREEKQQQIDWTAVWGKMYPVLTAYQQTVDIRQQRDDQPVTRVGTLRHALQLLGREREECHLRPRNQSRYGQQNQRKNKHYAHFGRKTKIYDSCRVQKFKYLSSCRGRKSSCNGRRSGVPPYPDSTAIKISPQLP